MRVNMPGEREMGRQRDREERERGIEGESRDGEEMERGERAASDECQYIHERHKKGHNKYNFAVIKEIWYLTQWGTV